MIILINNKFSLEKNAKISIFSESFMYGYGIFETLRTYKEKKIFKEKEHLQRLFNSAKKIDLKIKYSKSQISKMLSKITKKSPHKIQRIKIIAIKEGIIITSTPLKIDKKIYEGVKCKTVQITRSLPEIKSLSYLDSFLSHKKAEKSKYYEAILTDKKGEIYEGAYSNIFWFEGNILCTRKGNVLPGITAKTVTKLSPYKIKYKIINIKELINKEEIFLTQTTKGILPITKINSNSINKGKAGEKTKNLIQIFHDHVKKTSK